MNRNIIIKFRVSESEKNIIDKIWQKRNISQELRNFILTVPKDTKKQATKYKGWMLQRKFEDKVEISHPDERNSIYVYEGDIDYDVFIGMKEKTYA
jgi:hypothetical protein